MPRPFHLLSIDIDAFVNPVALDIEEGAERLPEDEYSVDDLADVDDFLSRRCHLHEAHRIRGLHIRDHDEAYYIIERLVAEVEDSLVLHHVDAHADLGAGDPGWSYLLNEWLWLPPPRPHPAELTLGNWLAFAAASRWLQSLVYAAREPSPCDFPKHFGGDPFPPSALRFAPRRVDRFDQVLEKGPEVLVPLSIRNLQDFALLAPPDFVIVCQSPNFTPESADQVLHLTRARVQEDSLGLVLKPLWTPGERAG